MYKKVSYEIKCECCGIVFEAHNKRTRFCSRKCKDVAYRRSKGQDSRLEPLHIKCVICGKEFDTFNPSKKTCSIECSRENERIRKRKHERNRNRNRYERSWDEYIGSLQEQTKQKKEIEKVEKKWNKAIHTVERECVECGKAFYCLDSSNQKTCSKECSKRHSNRSKDKRIPKEQIIDSDITLSKLYKRDKGICYICNTECDFNSWAISKTGNKYPGDKYPEIEHVIPISRGGMHSWENVRLACRRCNAEKSDNIIKIEPMSRTYAYSEKKTGTLPKRTAQMTMEGELIKVWNSTEEIKRKLGLNNKRIQDVCRGKGKTAFGYKWKYL